MARNGSGTYSLPAGNPVTTGTTISSTWANSTLNDLGSAMTASLAYDGQTTPVANLPMGGYLHTNVANATARTNYAAAGQVQDGTLQYLTSVSGTDTITATAPISMTAYATGQTFRFVAAATNTSAVTININSIGAKSITKNGATALIAGNIAINSVVEIIYDGTQFQVLNPNVTTSLGTMSTQNANAVAITGGTISGLSSPLPVASGGTGAATFTSNAVLLGNGTGAITAVAPSTAGNVLTSNGTTWTSSAPTSLPPTTLYEIGTYVIGRPQNTTLYALDSTIAGSSLYATNTAGFWVPSTWLTRYGSFTEAFTPSLINTGTWRCVSPTGQAVATGAYSAGLWLRIS
jgi:hypothetical protein